MQEYLKSKSINKTVKDFFQNKENTYDDIDVYHKYTYQTVYMPHPGQIK